MRVRAESLVSLRLFDGLNRVQLGQAAGAFQRASYTAGEIAVFEGQTVDWLALVTRGRFRVVRGDPEVELAHLEPGQLIGEPALVDGSWRRSATVQALEPSEVLLLHPWGLETLRDCGSPVAERLEAWALRLLAGQLSRTREAISRVVGTGCPRAVMPSPWQALGRQLAVEAIGRPSAPGSALDALCSAPTLAGTGLGDLTQLAVRGHLCPHPRGGVVIAERAVPDRVGVVLQGGLELRRACPSGGEVQVGRLRAGELVSPEALAPGAAASASVVATATTWIFHFAAHAVQEGPPTLWAAVRRAGLVSLVERLAAANQALGELVRRRGGDPRSHPEVIESLH